MSHDLRLAQKYQVAKAIDDELRIVIFEADIFSACQLNAEQN